jgi:hypothetical protein
MSSRHFWKAAPADFEHGYVTCSECQRQADLWSVVLGRAVLQPPIPMCLVGLGASETHFTRAIETNKYHEIDLTDVGIPADATALQVGYTSQGGKGGAVFPIEWHGNVRQRRIVAKGASKTRSLLTARRLQIPHRQFHVRMAKPLLHGPQIDTSPKTPRCKHRTEFVNPLGGSSETGRTIVPTAR